jgi:small nuclear ribonucleoprotein (snRNP)-like protein
MGFLGDKTKKKMSGWIGNTMSIGGRLVKIDDCLFSSVSDVDEIVAQNKYRTNGQTYQIIFSGLVVLIKENIIL